MWNDVRQTIVGLGICWSIVGSVPLTQAAEAAEKKYETDAAVETSLAVSTALLFGIGHLTKPERPSLTPEEIEALDPQDVNAFDRSALDNWSPAASRASDYMVWGSMVAPLSLLSSEQGRDEAGVLGVMYLETALLSAGMTYVIKNLSGRTRPYVYNKNPEISMAVKTEFGARRSFSSGHTATAFSSLVFLATVFDRLHPNSSASGWVWGGCLAAATTTGYLRYAAGRHFPTDIIAGAAVGAFAGWVVPQLHEWEPDPTSGPGETRPAGQSVIGFRVGF